MSRIPGVLKAPRTRRLAGAAALSVCLGLTALTGLLLVENYPAPDGLVLPNGGLVGGDFVAFWVGGYLYDNDRPRLYDLPYQSETRGRLLGPAEEVLDGELPFAYPPVVAAALGPLSRLSLQQAFAVFAGIGLFSALLSLGFLAKSLGLTSPRTAGILLIVTLGFVPFGLNTVLGGQFSWLGIVVLSLVSAFLIRGEDFRAGLAMSLSYYKPPLFVLLLLALIAVGKRRFIGGFAAGAVVLMALTIALVGTDGLRTYLDVAANYRYGRTLTDTMAIPSTAGMGLVGMAVTLTGSMSTAVVILAVPFLLLVFWIRSLVASGALRSGLTLGVVSTVAFSLQINKYDLALLLPAALLMTSWHRSRTPGPGVAAWAFLGLFYFEFAFREMQVGGSQANGTWVLFPPLLVALASASRGSAKPQASKEATV